MLSFKSPNLPLLKFFSGSSRDLVNYCTFSNGDGWSWQVKVLLLVYSD